MAGMEEGAGDSLFAVTVVRIRDSELCRAFSTEGSGRPSPRPGTGALSCAISNFTRRKRVSEVTEHYQEKLKVLHHRPSALNLGWNAPPHTNCLTGRGEMQARPGLGSLWAASLPGFS